MFFGRLSSMASLGLLLVGCGSSEEAVPPEPTDFMAYGPTQVTTVVGTLDTEDCTLAYTLYEPQGAEGAPLVVLGHGFARGQATMAGIADHIASFGLRVVTPQFCFLSVTTVDHPKNGRDAAALAASLADGGPVALAGYSAGGLAAVLGAAQSPETVAVLGLDPVDNEGQGAAVTVDVPMLALFGAPSACNAESNGVAMVDGAASWGVRVVGASHCDFEDPTNALCTGLCGETTGVLDAVKAIAAGFAAWQLGVDDSGERWASPEGSAWQQLVDEGVLAPL